MTTNPAQPRSAPVIARTIRLLPAILVVAHLLGDQALAQMAPVSLGPDPGQVRYSPDGSRLAVADRVTNTVTVLNPAIPAVLASLPVGPGPADLAFSPDGLLLLVANAGNSATPGSTVTVIGVPALNVLTTIAVGSGPSRIGMRPTGGVAYVLNRGGSVPDDRVSVISLSTLSVIATLTLGRSPLDVAFSSDGSRAIVTSLFPGQIHLVDAVGHALLVSSSVLPTPAGIVFRPGTHQALVANAELGSGCALVNADTLAVTPGPSALAARTFMVMHPDGTRVYSLASSRNSLSVVSASDGHLITWGLLATGHEADIGPDMGFQVLDVAVPASGAPSVITANADGMLQRWNAATDQLVGALYVGGPIKALDASPNGLNVALTMGDTLQIMGIGSIPGLAGPIE